MFVGVGELVPRPPVLRTPDPGADPAAGKNRRLPILANEAHDEAESKASDET
jgi:hypothetical protein